MSRGDRPNYDPDLHRPSEQIASTISVNIPTKWKVLLEEQAYELTEPGWKHVGVDDLARIAIKEFLYGETEDVDDALTVEEVREVVREELAAWDAAGEEKTANEQH